MFMISAPLDGASGGGPWLLFDINGRINVWFEDAD